MKLVDLWGIERDGRWLDWRYLPERRGPSRYEPCWLDEHSKLHRLNERQVDQLLTRDFGGKHLGGDRWQIELPNIMVFSYRDGWQAVAESFLTKVEVRKVRMPACGCCGANPSGYNPPWRPIREVAPGIWRCEKHVDRNPCCIAGCGKTFAHKGDDSYENRVMCGKCWRQAPRWMRDREARIRKLCNKRGWPHRLARLHGMAWEACHRKIVRQRSTPGFEAVLESAPPPASLLKELEALGL